MKAALITILVAVIVAAATGFVAAEWTAESRLSTLEGQVSVIREQVAAIHAHLLGE